MDGRKLTMKEKAFLWDFNELINDKSKSTSEKGEEIRKIFYEYFPQKSSKKTD